MSATGIHERSGAVEVVFALGIGFAPRAGIYIFGLGGGKCNIYSAHRINTFFKCGEIYTDIPFDIHLRAFVHLAHHKICAAVTEGVGKPIVLTLVFPFKYRHIVLFR